MKTLNLKNIITIIVAVFLSLTAISQAFSAEIQTPADSSKQTLPPLEYVKPAPNVGIPKDKPQKTELPKAEVIYDRCYVIKMFGEKTGFLCAKQRRAVEKGRSLIITERHFENKLKRLNNIITMTNITTYIEEESGKPLSFGFISETPSEKTKIDGKFTSDYEIEANFDVNGNKNLKTVKFKEAILFPYAVDKLYKNPSKKIISYASIEPSVDLKTVKIKTERLDPPSGITNKTGQPETDLTKYRVSASILPGITSYEWRDTNGLVVKESSSLFNIEQTLIRDKSEIENISPNYDLFSASMIALDKPLPDLESIQELDYKIIFADMIDNYLFMQDERQKISKTKNIENNVINLKVKTMKYQQLLQSSNFPYPLNIKGYEEYLKSGDFIMPENEGVKAIANLLSEGEKNSYAIAKKMEGWVNSNITTKDFSLDFANAAQIMEEKRGDCTEHSVLLASLLRAAGIPSRTVVGLVYTKNPSPSFGYHMWTQALIGYKNLGNKNIAGETPTPSEPYWVNLDAAIPYNNFTAGHIALSTSPLNTFSDRSEILMGLLKVLSGIKIEVQKTSKPLISNLASGVVKISLSNSADSDFFTIKTMKNNYSNGTQKISLSGFEEKDFIRSGYYNFVKGDIQKSLNDFNSFYSSVVSDDASFMRLGLKLSGLGFFNLASKSFSKIQEKNIWDLQVDNVKKIYFPAKIPSNSDEVLLASALSKIMYQNSPSDALELLNKNKTRFKNSDYFNYINAKAYIAQNKTEQAVNFLRKAIKQNPTNLIYRMELAKFYSLKNSYKSAERELNAVKSLVNREQIKDAVFLSEYEEQYYWLKFKLERANPIKGKYYKAKYYESKREYEAALDVFRDILPNNPNKSVIYESIGQVYLKKNDPEKARDSFTKALQLNKSNVSAISGLGQAYFELGGYRNALNQYTSALRIKPDDAMLKLKTAEIYEILGQEEEAFNYYKEVLLTENPRIEANYNLGMMYLRTGDINEAEKFLKKALRENPLYSLIWLDIAGLELARGNVFAASEYLKPVSNMDFKTADYYYYSGLIANQQGDIDSAKSYFGQALELNPNYQEVIDALKRL